VRGRIFPIVSLLLFLLTKKRITIQCHRAVEKQGIIFNAIIDWNVRIIQDTPYITLVMVTNN